MGSFGELRLVSYAGLTRVSINLRNSLANEMGCRVKPGHDGSYLGGPVVPHQELMDRAQRRPRGSPTRRAPRRMSPAENTFGREI